MLVKTAVNGGRLQSKLFWGDWSERYFEETVPEMKNIFTFQKPINGINIDLYHSMKNRNSVAIHVRRGII
jgi:hypothetical protein